MKKLLASIALALALVSASTPSIPATPSHEVTRKEWAFVCDTLKEQGFAAVDCRKIDRPQVIVSKVVGDMADPGEVLYGFYYLGEDFIFVNPESSPEDQRKIVVHEATHYVLWMTYGDKVGSCKSEEVARRVHHAWEGSDYDDTWRLFYRC